MIRIDGFSSPDQYDEEALSLWAPDVYEDNELDLETSKYILSYIGDKFCQLVLTENTAATWIKKDGKPCSRTLLAVILSQLALLLLPVEKLF